MRRDGSAAKVLLIDGQAESCDMLANALTIISRSVDQLLLSIAAGIDEAGRARDRSSRWQ